MTTAISAPFTFRSMVQYRATTEFLSKDHQWPKILIFAQRN